MLRTKCHGFVSCKKTLRKTPTTIMCQVWFPCPACSLGSKRLAVGRGRAFRSIEAAEKLKVYGAAAAVVDLLRHGCLDWFEPGTAATPSSQGPGPRVPRSQPTVNYCLSPEGW